MKMICRLFVILFLLSFQLTANSQSDNQHPNTFRNPLPVAFGDPYVLFVEGFGYYMYGTGGGAVNGFSAYSSPDLVNWKPEGQVYFGNNVNGWGNGAYWAPEVYKVKDKYYMFYSAQWSHNPGNELENFRIGVAVSDSPAGPFTDLHKQPIFDPGYPIIDANVYFDDDGRMYLYYSRCCYKHPVDSEIAHWAKKKGWYDEIEESWIYGVELKPDFTGVIGKPELLLRPPVKMNDKQQEWESRSVTAREANRRWTEGSVTFKKDGLYYMMYSANFFGGQNYAVGYATSNDPLGPFKKSPTNPVLQKNTASGGNVTGTGHNSITYSPDGKEMFCVYHGRTAATGDERVVFIDRMTIDKNKKLVVHGPTTDPQPLPSGLSGDFYQIKIYHLTSGEQEKTVDQFLQNAYLPALHKAGIGKVGVFKPIAEDNKDTGRKIYVLIPFRSPDEFFRLSDSLAVDEEYGVAARDYLDAPHTNPPYKRIEVILLTAFEGSPRYNVPQLKSPRKERVYELRNYEGHTEKISRNKIDMFNKGDEIGLFKRLGFNPVFYGEVISGSRMPNMMYLTTFENRKDRDAHWQAFINDPQWKKISAMPEYQNNMSRLESILLYPTDYSDL